jgi:hypothetical protein
VVPVNSLFDVNHQLALLKIQSIGDMLDEFESPCNALTVARTAGAGFET